MHTKIDLPLLTLRDIVVFPGNVIPLFVGRDKSITALNEVMKNDKKIVLVTQKNSEVDDPKQNDVFAYGCESNILQLLKLPDGTVKVLVEGIKRVKIINYKDNDKYIIFCSPDKLPNTNSPAEQIGYHAGFHELYTRPYLQRQLSLRYSYSRKPSLV